jgi:hypothetical protein
LIRKVLKEFILEKEFKKPRKMKQSYCKKTPCKEMGFSQKLNPAAPTKIVISSYLFVSPDSTAILAVIVVLEIIAT